MARKRSSADEQPSLFDIVPTRPSAIEATRTKVERPGARQWQMPELQGRTIAEIRLRWTKRLTPAQVARVEAELSGLPKQLAKLGFGAVQVERVFVRRRKNS